MPTIKKLKNRRPRIGDAYSEERRKVYATRAWRRLRLAKLADSPLCEMCLQRGFVKVAIDVHHKRSFMSVTGAERDACAYDYDNLMSLCKECHQQIHNANGATEKKI